MDADDQQFALIYSKFGNEAIGIAHADPRVDLKLPLCQTNVRKS